MQHIIRLCLLALAICTCAAAMAQQDENGEDLRYRRSSIYSLLINHVDQKYSPAIMEAFMELPIPNKFNDHNLSIKVFNTERTFPISKKAPENRHITYFLRENKIASRLIAKWFERDFYTGACNLELIKERGVYDASVYDQIMAENSLRAQRLLEDAGEELIGKTFVLVSDIQYVDKSGIGSTLGMIAGTAFAATAIVGTAKGVQGSDQLLEIGQKAGTGLSNLKSFKVKVNTYLYQLVWDDEAAGTFYKMHYSAAPDAAKAAAFDKGRGTYRLEYIGMQASRESSTSMSSVKKPLDMVKKSCQRALDENIAALQLRFEPFRIKSPLISAEPLRAYVGMKEGITEKSRFEVLEVVEDADGRRSYKRVGVIKPMKKSIWDNRYMAAEEGTASSRLGYTTFQKVSGGSFSPGMLIREISR